MIDIKSNIPLINFSTMRLGGTAKYMTEVKDRHDVTEAISWAHQQKIPIVMIGGGSNIIWTDEGWPGLVLINQIIGFEVFVEDNENTYLTLGSGENWDSVVARSTEQGLHGIEALSMIPGTVGAAPIQNIGAYGQELSDVLVSIEAYDSQVNNFITIPAADCAFGYRTSRFKTTDKNRFFITSLTMHLTSQPVKPPFYKSLQAYFDQNNITSFEPKTIRNAVISLRNEKLPDPNSIASSGSFFHNPIINTDTFTQLQANYPDIVHWELDNDNIKLSAGWLIEQAGFKGVHDHETGMACWPKQALILVNEHAKSTADLLLFKQKIVDKIQTMFNITLQQEPELIEFK